MADLPYVFTGPFASSAVSRLVRDIRDDVPGALDTNIMSALYRAADEFFERSNVWYIDVDIVLVVNQTTYSMATPVQGSYNRMLVLYDSQDANKNWVDKAQFIRPTGIMITTVPKTAATWVARMAMKCANIDDNTLLDVPDQFVQAYRDAFYYGTRRNLHMSGGKPYSDGQLGAAMGKLFNQQWSQARIDSIKGNVYGQTNWTFPAGPFTRGSQRS